MPLVKRGVTIAGGGLAGLSLAAGLRRRDVRVTVIEAGQYPRHRVCGEFISGVSSETLEALGIEDLFVDALRHRSLLWSESGLRLHEDTLPEAALGISRYVLDERLWRRVTELGGEVITGTRGRSSSDEGFVWAAGRKATLGKWVGLKGHALYDGKEADLEMHLGNNGYVGLAGVEEGWVNVCGLFAIDKSLRAQGPDLLIAYLEAGGNTGLANTLREATWREGSFSAVAGFAFGRQSQRVGVCAVGDAESMIPPFTGNGMSMAFQAAECALDPLTHWAEGVGSWSDTMNKVKIALHRRFIRRLRVARLLHGMLLDARGRTILRGLATRHLLPFRLMTSLVR